MARRTSSAGADGVRTDHLIWDDWNQDRIAGHGVDRDEVEEVIDGGPFITRARDGLHRVIGQTYAGRFLTIYVAPRHERRYYVVTARDATTKERRALRRHLRPGVDA